MELHPVVEAEPTPHFGFRQVAGNERKTTGSYYTPTSLVTCLLDSALDPVLEDRIQNFKALGFKSVDEAVLALNVCDPACGSGHFLIAAAQRIARRLALLRSRDEEPDPELLRHSLREVIGHCIHGVDVNPMSVELCKVALWLEAVEPGKSLNFLDHHIKCGNSLLGATPEFIRDGIPDKAYEPITGDNKEAAKWMRNSTRTHEKDRATLILAALHLGNASVICRLRWPNWKPLTMKHRKRSKARNNLPPNRRRLGLRKRSVAARHLVRGVRLG